MAMDVIVLCENLNQAIVLSIAVNKVKWRGAQRIWKDLCNFLTIAELVFPLLSGNVPVNVRDQALTGRR